MRSDDLWFNTDPVTPNYVQIMSCTYEGWTNVRDIISYFGSDVNLITSWLNEHGMDGRYRYDHRASRDMVTNNIKVIWYVVFDNLEDRTYYNLCKDDILNEMIEGIM